MTATLAAVAGGGAALAFHGSSARPPKGCGLVPCAAALPASVRSGDTGPGGSAGPGGRPASPGPSSGTGAASAPATTAPTAVRQSPAPSSPALSPSAPVSARPAAARPVAAARIRPARIRPARIARPVSARPVSARPVSAAPVPRPGSFSSPAPVSSATGRAVSADHAVGVGYAITEDGQQGIHGQIVMVNNGPAPVSGWRVTLVLPGDRGYQVLDARNRSAGDALVMTAPADGRSLAPGGTALIAFTARGTTSSPVRSTFTAPARPRPAGGGSGAARPGHQRRRRPGPRAAPRGLALQLARWPAERELASGELASGELASGEPASGEPASGGLASGGLAQPGRAGQRLGRGRQGGGSPRLARRLVTLPRPPREAR